MALMPAFLPRESSALLTRDFAIHAAHLFQDPQQAGEDKVSLQNIYRLLELYRFDAFAGYVPRGILDVGMGHDPEGDDDAMVTEGDALKTALDAAKARVFPQIEKQAVVEQLEQLVRALAGRIVPNAADLQQAKRFFEELATALKAA
jgi:hypothetical protein